MEEVYSVNPMKRGLYNQLMGLDEKVFREGVKQMLQYYNKLLKEVDGVKYLPKGTILYHGSLHYPFYGDSQDVKNITYLGLDIDISMWYIYESIINQQHTLKSLKDKITGSESFKRYGFLYAFKLVEDLPITHIIDKIYLNPKEIKKCKKDTCLHPQISYRGGDFNYIVGSKIHTELTLNYNTYKEYFEIIRVYIIDGLSLHKNHGDIKYNVRDAILQEYKEGTEYELPISYQEYSEMFVGDIFYCEYNCGYSGNYEDVLEHEQTCELKAAKKKKKKKRMGKKSKRMGKKSKRMGKKSKRMGKKSKRMVKRR